ncbi:MAG: HEAT repeat domain-containing protein [Candidatus Binatia bacterium]
MNARHLLLAVVILAVAGGLWLRFRSSGAERPPSAALVSYRTRLANESAANRAKTVRDLGLVGSADAFRTITERLRQDPSTDVRVAAVEALILYAALDPKHEPEVLDPLHRAADSGVPAVEDEARHALAALAQAGQRRSAQFPAHRAALGRAQDKTD